MTVQHNWSNLLRHRTALLNVIPYNRVEGLPYVVTEQGVDCELSEDLGSRWRQREVPRAKRK